MTKKDIIVKKAIELFAQHGFENTSIQNLAEKSGVAQGLLYRHFKNKNDLLTSLLEMGMMQVKKTLEPYADPKLGLKEAFAAQIQMAYEFLESNYLLWKVLHNVRQNSALMNSLGFSGDIKRDIVMPISKKLKKEGYKNPEMIGWLILSLVDGMTTMYLLHPDVYPIKKVKKFLIEKLLAYDVFNS